ncbi:PREDICTED: uncharacterized protein LOC106808371 [Priapulus caudatus]|uniref:Uncharacterized protein LOC106808371 n=1 Tax=Priapulus caudatus TaxID=37621 RepID=A0ABM1E2Y6_PRICU|nr:PREDICTED: uncharacterized protein LOC106808371 [Priapulus caudatus]
MDLVEERLSKSKLYFDVEVKKWPIIYSKAYNIGFLKMEKLHPFDSGKWGRVHQFLKDGKMLTDDTTVVPYEATEDDLMVVHSQRYLDSLKLSYNVARITEVPPVAFVPNMFVQWRVLTPIKHQVGGTILAGKLAMERGWAINIGGGFHHCSADSGGGFCIYADITLCVKYLFAKVERVKKAMIIDLDAHQGNGYQRDFMHDDRVYIMDVFNSGIYPRDEKAKENNTDGGVVKGTYTIWRGRNPNIFPATNSNTLANTRRWIIKNNNLIDTELEQIVAAVQTQNNALQPTLIPTEQPEDLLQPPDPEAEQTPQHTDTHEGESVVDMEDRISTKLLETQAIPLDQRRSLKKVHLNKAIRHDIQAANQALTNIIKDNHLYLSEIKELMLRWFTKQSEHYYQNKLFHEDAKKFYRHLNEQQSTIKEPPSQDQLDQILAWNTGITYELVSHHLSLSLSLSVQGIIQRDELVFRKARERSIAIVMLTSGGYQHSTARIIADSILNLWQKKLIAQPEAELAVACERRLLRRPTQLAARRHGTGLFSRLRLFCSSQTADSTPSSEEFYGVAAARTPGDRDAFRSPECTGETTAEMVASSIDDSRRDGGAAMPHKAGSSVEANEATHPSQHSVAATTISSDVVAEIAATGDAQLCSGVSHGYVKPGEVRREAAGDAAAAARGGDGKCKA